MKALAKGGLPPMPLPDLPLNTAIRLGALIAQDKTAVQQSPSVFWMVMAIEPRTN